jgi:hypothetical protein
MNKPTNLATREELKEFFAKGAPKQGCAYMPIGTIGDRVWYAVTSTWDGYPYARIAYLYGNDVNDFYNGNGWDGAIIADENGKWDDDYNDAGLTAFDKRYADDVAEWALARFARLAIEF